jgi:hypothetical protein
MSSRVLFVAALVGVAVAMAIAGCGSAQPVVKNVNHITISGDNAKALFDTLNGTLGLPVAWPFSEYPGYSTGGVQAGNVNLEALQLGPTAQGGTAKALIYGIVLEPYPLAESVPELKARGAQPGKPEVQMIDEGGKKVPVWTNVTLKALSFPDYIVYLNQYSEMYKKLLASHVQTGVKEVTISSKDDKALKDKWAKAFAPDKFTSDGVMAIGAGPAVRIVSGPVDAITSLTFEVASLASAKSALEKDGMLGESTSSSLTVEPSKVQGLNLVLVEK